MQRDIVDATRNLLPPGHVYADWAASALPLPLSHAPPFIPPHHHDSTTLDRARAAVRTFLDDPHNDYHIVFTSGATAAFDLLANRLPWSSNSALYLHHHVHNAVLGIRNVACVRHAAAFHSFSTHELDHHLSEPSIPLTTVPPLDVPSNTPPFALLAFPAECNLTGTLYPLSWASRAKRTGFLHHSASSVITLVDTAKRLASAPFSLRANPDVDALIFSLYKLSASYTGLAALLIRRDSLLERLLQSTAATSYFGGGSGLQAVTPFSLTLYAPSNDLTAMLQFGTPNQQALYHLPSQLAHFPGMKFSVMHNTCVSIARRFEALLLEAFGDDVTVHFDGFFSKPVRSATTALSLRARGTLIPPVELATILSLNGIFVRAGAMCNIGGTASILGLSDTDVQMLFANGHRCHLPQATLDGRPVGLVRVSFGWASLEDDAVTIVDVLKKHVGYTGRRLNVEMKSKEMKAIVQALFVYPVTGCGGRRVSTAIGIHEAGLLGDRAWVIRDALSGELLRVSNCTALARVTAGYTDGGKKLVLSMDGENAKDEIGNSEVVVEVQMMKDAGKDEMVVDDEKVDEWLCMVTGRKAQLVRVADATREKRNVLVICWHELRMLSERSGLDMESLLKALRPNMVVGGMESGMVLQYKRLKGEDVMFVKRRDCMRCKTVNLICGELGVGCEYEPLRSIGGLSRERHGKTVTFGVVGTLVVEEATRTRRTGAGHVRQGGMMTACDDDE